MRDLLHPVLFTLLVAGIGVIAQVGLRRVEQRIAETRKLPPPADPPDA